MSVSTTSQATEPFFEVPGGFPPDTLGFAVRTVAALMLAYYVSFWIQLSSASTAGVCVAIVAQPQTGGTVSKAAYRVLGTLIGGIAAVIASAVFGQDRTMLLVVFTVWLAGCSFTASLLKDFRAYGAALAGYTLAIVSITDIDVTQDVFLTALDRIAAILIGVVSMLLVNGIFGPANTWQALTNQLRLMITQTTEEAIRIMRGEATPASVAEEVECASAILALRTQASFVAGELQDGWQRAAGARNAIVALLGMLSASRGVAAGLALTEPDPIVRQAIDRCIRALRETNFGMTHPPQAEPHEVATLPQAYLLERLDDLRAQHALALEGLATLAIGRQPLRRVHLRVYHDLIGALLNATRTTIVVGLAALFCIYAGWSGATFLLVQLSAVVTLLGMQPNPTMAAIAFGAQVPLAIVAAALVEFFLLTQAGNFVSFTLAVAPFALVACILARHPRTMAGATTGMLTWYVLMLAPANPPSYDLAAFLNTAIEFLGSMVAVVVGFAVILPVSPPRRLFRVAQSTRRNLRRALRERQIPDRAAILSSCYDRYAAGLLWLGRRTPARLSLLSRIHDFGQLEAAVGRAQAGLQATLQEVPALADEVAAARTALLQPGADEVQAAAAALLAAARVPGTVPPAVLQAVSGLYGASILLRRQQRFLRLAGFPVRD